MACKQLTFSSAAREKALRGTSIFANGVRVSLEPRSNSVLSRKKWDKPPVCKHGVTIAAELELTGSEEKEAPTRQMGESYAADGGVVVEKLRAGAGSFGFDAAKGRYVDVVEPGIVVPTKVVWLALENAVSVATILLLTEATLTEIPEPKREAVGAAEGFGE